MEITKRDLKKQTEEIKRHNDVLYEKFERKIDIVSEGWNITKEKVDATFGMVGEMKMDMEVVKSDISFIGNRLNTPPLAGMKANRGSGAATLPTNPP